MAQTQNSLLQQQQPKKKKKKKKKKILTTGSETVAPKMSRYMADEASMSGTAIATWLRRPIFQGSSLAAVEAVDEKLADEAAVDAALATAATAVAGRAVAGTRVAKETLRSMAVAVDPRRGQVDM